MRKPTTPSDKIRKLEGHPEIPVMHAREATSLMFHVELSKDHPVGTPDVIKYVRFLRSGSPGPHAYVILLGLRAFDAPKLFHLIDQGISFRALDRLHQNTEFSLARIAEIVQIAPRTLTRRRQEGRLRPDESDRLLRATRLFARALALFEGNTAAARRWLESPQLALGGAVPTELARSEVGTLEVERAIGRIEHGVFA